MKVEKLKTYLDKYQDSEEVRFFLANPKESIIFPNYGLVTVCVPSQGVPVIAMTANKSIPMDREEILAAEEDERNAMSDMWIRADKRLPVPGKRYLVSVAYKESSVIQVSDAAYGSDGLWHKHHYEPMDESIATVVAWMPMPEPYKEETR